VKIDANLARQAIKEKIADPLGITVEQAALGIIKILNSNMSLTIRANSVAKGFDPRKFALVPFGGAGPLNGVALAEAVFAREIIVPPAPGITAAIGLLETDMQYEVARSVLAILKNVKPEAVDRINSVIDDLTRLCRERLDDDEVPADKQSFIRIAECRYHGQGFELRAEIPGGPLTLENIDKVKESFHEQHRRDYGWAFDDVDVEIVTIRIIGVAKTQRLRWPKLEQADGTSIEQSLMYRRPTIFDNGKTCDTPRYERSKLKAGHLVPGPAIIVQHDSTTLVPPNYVARVKDNGNIHINAKIA
jgi:N-methylhydantoinase A